MSDGPDKAARREAKRQYLESYRPAGAYQIRNTKNGKLFVGTSPNLPAVFNRWRMELNTHAHRRYPELQKDWDEHGEEAFELTVLEELEPPDAPGWDPTDDLAALEELWIEQLRPWGERGYLREPQD